MNSLKKVDLARKHVILGLVGAGDENVEATDKLTKRVEMRGGNVSEFVYMKGVPLDVDRTLSEEEADIEAQKIILKL